MPTFQQTFANCPFPEGVLAVLGGYPVQVRVLKSQRAMEVVAKGAAVPQEILSQASEALKRTLGLSAATVEVDAPPVPTPEPKEEPAPAIPPQPEPSLSAPRAAAENPAAAQEIPAAQPTPPQDLEAQMKAMRRKLLKKDAPAAGSSGGGKKQGKAIYGIIRGRKPPTPIGELNLDMGTVLVEGEVFNIEHRELARSKAWVVCFDVTDFTGSIRVTRYMKEEDNPKPIIEQVKKGQWLQIQGRPTLGRFDNNDLVLDPYGIKEAPKPEGRKDTAPEKRVELHLHTQGRFVRHQDGGEAGHRVGPSRHRHHRPRGGAILPGGLQCLRSGGEDQGTVWGGGVLSERCGRTGGGPRAGGHGPGRGIRGL